MMHNEITSLDAGMTLLFHAVAPSRGVSEFTSEVIRQEVF